MTIEATIYSTLTALVGGRVYPDVAPVGVVRPYITYQNIGGEAVNFLDQVTVPSRKRRRFQVNVWSDTRETTAALAIQVEDAMRAAPVLQTTVEGAPIAIYELDTNLRGSMQDFSVVF